MEKANLPALRLIKSGRTDVLTLDTLEACEMPGVRALHGELLVYRGGMCDGREQESIPLPVVRSDFYQLSLIRSGSLSAQLDQQDLRLHAGDLVLIPPYSRKRLLEVEPDTEVSTLFFTTDLFKRSTLRGINERIMPLGAGVPQRMHLVNDQMLAWDEQVSRIQYRIDGMLTHTYGRALVLSAFNELLLEAGHLVQDRTDRPSVTQGRKDTIVHEFMELARVYHATQRHLAFYSDRLFVTSKHLSETLKEVTGRTARQLLDQLLLSEAKHLLSGTALSISEVAFKLNFEEPSQFSKFFHRTSGSSPRRYRVGQG